ncbi:ATP-dependent DNA helicase [Aeromonas hydrophila]|uniref:ATP-dependent DNA helicase n=1 Tax=Aeromonas hydrophila TaxID=644 RepID=UPI00140F8207|nr:ATP-dependent DNA helicase [Aeromonas hydrophila]NHT33203.1 ATP-dependent DNA helicase [Aeromonas hydrophila]
MTIQTLFKPDGPLASHIDGFKARAPQLEMAEAVARAIKEHGRLLVEAGTGTGKTYAYLVPALESGKRVVISTGSKNLQEQLFYRDLPTITGALSYTPPVALLKGRSNYLCIERMNRLLSESHLQKPEVLNDLVKVKSWSTATDNGDVGDIPGLQENAEILAHVTSTNENCLGRDCPYYDDCHLVVARRRAMDAQVVVINHHLFFADMAVKDTGFGELVPEAQVYVFDEAHQLPEIATNYFGKSVGSRTILDLAQDIQLAYRAEAHDMAQLGKAADRLAIASQDLRLAFGVDGGRGNTRDMLRQPLWGQALARLNDALGLCYEVLKLALGRGEQLDHCFERISELRTRLGEVLAINQTGFSYWYDCSRLHFTLNLTPLSVAERFGAEVLRPEVAWVFTSATLTVDMRFDHFKAELGLAGSAELILDSPFDYGEQARLCVPRFLPEPNAFGRGEQLANLMIPLINKTPGGCFFLCTSHQVMRQVAEVLRREIGRTVLLQGEDNKQRLLKEFVENGRAVLVATSSFWEGIDVRGAALSCVIIDKLPFASPDDPQLKARVDDCKLRGGAPFADIQLPKAVIALKQGVGRLIRDRGDHGVLVICDPRMVNKPYGATFIKSLPAIPRTRELAMLGNFFEQQALAGR